MTREITITGTVEIEWEVVVEGVEDDVDVDALADEVAEAIRYDTDLPGTIRANDATLWPSFLGADVGNIDYDEEYDDEED